MFKSLRIKNIQSHEDTYIKFSKGVTVIIGDSDQGKSAIFNSLYWVLQNRPLGEQHRSWWGGEMLSELEMDNGTIQLKRNKQSIYTINPKTDNITFKAFGQHPPQEITDLINIDTKINIQRQLERGVPIFLLSESPGDVAKFFNKVANIDKIDTAIKTGKRDLRQTELDYKTTKEQIKDKKEELSFYKGIDSLKYKIDKALKLEKDLEYIKQNIFDIETKIENVTNTKESIKTKEKKFKILSEVNKVIEKQNQIQKIQKELHYFEKTKEEIKLLKTLIKNNEQKITLLPEIKKGLTVIENMKLNKTELNTIEQLFNSQISTLKQIEYLTTQKLKTKAKFNKLMPKQCLLCNQPVNRKLL